MNKIDFILKMYEALHNRKGISPFFFSPFRRLVRTIARKNLHKLLCEEELNTKVPVSDIIVSLTSFPARINDVHLVIRCLLRQTIRPSKIILWLSKDQFDDFALPASLTNLQNEVFEIRFVDGDIRSHKKYYYALKEFPDSKIFLVDDDLYYPSHMIESVLAESRKFPNHIICRYGSVVKFANNVPYAFHRWWREIAQASNDQNIFFGSGGGTLLSKDFLYEDILNISLAKELTPTADDIWLNAMVNLKGTKKRKIKCGLILQIESQQNVRLTAENTGNNMNDVQFESIINYYKNSQSLNPFSKRQ